jgi:hypothetical protein
MRATFFLGFLLGGQFAIPLKPFYARLLFN